MLTATLRTVLLGAALLAPLAASAQVRVTDDISADVTWSASNVYLLDGLIFVNDGATLTIEPGTVIKGVRDDRITTGDAASALIIRRGGKIMADGTAADPIIFTAEDDDVNDPGDLTQRDRGEWGGIIILGKASTNQPTTDNQIEGIPFDANAGTGDEAILPVPCWVSYAPQVQIAGGKAVEVQTSGESGFRMTPDQLRAAITPKSRVLVINSPSNPCGTMYSPDELRALAAVVAEAASSTSPRLVVITDEIYEKIIFGGREHLSMGSIDSIADRVITINGLSKAYAMTGWRVGYAACPGEFGLSFIKAMDRIQSQMTSGIPTFIMPAIEVALKECSGYVAKMVDAFEERAQLIEHRLRDVPGVEFPSPEGAFYVFADISAHFGKTAPDGTKITSAMTFAEALLNNQKMAIVPGEDFGGCGDKCIRISYACGEDQINAGIDRLAALVRSLS